jgi:hypothetical protein
MPNSSKYVLNKENVIKVKFQNPIVNDGSGQSINHLHNLIRMSGTMGSHEHGLETYGTSISVQTMYKQQNNVNRSFILKNAQMNQDQQGNVVQNAQYRLQGSHLNNPQVVPMQTNEIFAYKLCHTNAHTI